MTQEERLERFMPAIKKVARNTAYKNELVEYEDILQELTLIILGRPDIPVPGPENPGFSPDRILWGEARLYAFRLKQQHYLISGEYSYQMGEVKLILETHFDQDHWTSVASDESVEDAVAIHSDVAWALDRLSPAEKQFVAEKYTTGSLPKSGTPEYRKLREILIHMTNMLNHYTRADEHEGPGRRKTLSNSASNTLIGNGTTWSNQ